VIVGIDLGTSNSLLAVFRNGEPMLVPNALGSVLTPSAVSMAEDGTIVVGEAARDRAITHPDRTALAFKRAMGTNRNFMLGRRAFRAEELSALVLAALKADAEAMFGEPVTEAVVTVPAYFSDGQRQATRVAAQLAGLNVRRLLNEPTAAALAYGLLENDDDEAKLLILDLGGGTFDVSIIEKFEGIVEVRATAGDNFLGGEDFVDAIVGEFMRVAGDVPELAGKDGAALQAQLRRRAELLKREASSQHMASLRMTIGGREIDLTLSEGELTELYAPLLARLRGPIQRAMLDSRLTPSDISAVILAGGATRMPDVRRMAARLFKRMPIANIDPDEIVARGAAIYAALLARDEAFEEVVVTDVAPYTMGIEVASDTKGAIVAGLFSPIISRNTPIPVSRVQTYSTMKLGQTLVNVEVFQGESRLVRDNIRLGTIPVTVPRNLKANESFDVRFTYDRDGILEVEVMMHSTQRTWREVFQNQVGSMTQDEIEHRLQQLAALKTHPRDQAENVAALARADRIFQEHIGARAAIQEYSGRFTLALEQQDPREIARVRKDLLAVLDRVESETWTFDDG
jgi:molecular chaperone HscC